jgi:hypothetical protein
MPNHFDWVVETPQPNLVVEMKWLLGTYTSRFNRNRPAGTPRGFILSGYSMGA